MHKLRSLSMTKIAPEKLRKDFLSIDFNLNDKFCDVNDLSYSWQSLPISDGMLAFFHPFSASIQQNCIQTTQNILIHTEIEDDYNGDTDDCDEDITTSSCSAIIDDEDIEMSNIF